MNKKEATNKHQLFLYISKTLFFTFLFLFLLITCGRVVSDKPPAWGNLYEIIIVKGKDISDQLLQMIKDSLTGLYPMLPQPEPLVKCVVINSENFTSFYKKHKFILTLEKSTATEEVKFLSDVWAKGQKVITITGHSDQVISYLFFTQKSIIIRNLMDHYQKLLASELLNYVNTQDQEKLNKVFGKNILIPLSYHLVVLDTINKVAILRNETEIKETGLKTFIKKGYLIHLSREAIDTSSATAFINNVIGKYIKGKEDTNSIAVLNEPLPPQINFFPSTNLVEVRALWHIKGEFRGGPLYALIKTIKKPSPHTFLFVGYVFAPNNPKRNHMIELETIGKNIVASFN